MADLITVLMAVSLAILACVCGMLIRNFYRLEKRYRFALESNQRKLDTQTSRLNMLTRTLPNMKNLLTNPRQRDDVWKSVSADESRALIQADIVNFWRFIEKDQELELDVQGKDPVRIQLEDPSIGDVALRRVPRLMGPGKEWGGESSRMLVPFVVENELRGVYEYVRFKEPSLNQKDLDLIGMFLNHLSLALENRELIENREKFYLELVQTLADTLDSRDASTKGQTRRARELAKGIAVELEMPEEFAYYLEFAALIHDIGKIAIDDQILKKPGKLTPQEFEMIKKHPEFGYQIIAPVSMLAPVAPMVLYHQEWFNGKGYPEGLSGEEIPLGARIVAILDAWGAMTSDRPWRKAFPPGKAIEEIKKGANTQFDPQVVEAFIAVLKKQGLLSPAFT